MTNAQVNGRRMVPENWRSKALRALWQKAHADSRKTIINGFTQDVKGLMVPEVQSILEAEGIYWRQHNEPSAFTNISDWLKGNFPVTTASRTLANNVQRDFVVFYFVSLVDYAACKCYEYLRKAAPAAYGAICQELLNNSGLSKELVAQALQKYNEYFSKSGDVYQLVSPKRVVIPMPDGILPILRTQLRQAIMREPQQQLLLSAVPDRLPYIKYYYANLTEWLAKHFPTYIYGQDENGAVFITESTVTNNNRRNIRKLIVDHLTKNAGVRFPAKDLERLMLNNGYDPSVITRDRTQQQWLKELTDGTSLTIAEDEESLFVEYNNTSYPPYPFYTYQESHAEVQQAMQICYIGWDVLKGLPAMCGMQIGEKHYWIRYFAHALAQAFAGSNVYYNIDEDDAGMAFSVKLSTANDRKELYAILEQNDTPDRQPFKLVGFAYPGQQDERQYGRMLCERFGIPVAETGSSNLEKVRHSVEFVEVLRKKLLDTLPLISDALDLGVCGSVDAFLADLQQWQTQWRQLDEAVTELGWKYNMPVFSIDALHDQLSELSADKQAIIEVINTLDHACQTFLAFAEDDSPEILQPVPKAFCDQLEKDRLEIAGCYQATSADCQRLLSYVSVYKELLYICNSPLWDLPVNESAMALSGHFCGMQPFQFGGFLDKKLLTENAFDQIEAQLMRIQRSEKERVIDTSSDPLYMLNFLAEHSEDNLAFSYPPVTGANELEKALIHCDFTTTEMLLLAQCNGDPVQTQTIDDKLAAAKEQGASLSFLSAAGRLMAVVGNANQTMEKLLLQAAIHCRRSNLSAVEALLALYRLEDRPDAFLTLAETYPQALSYDDMCYSIACRLKANDATIQQELLDRPQLFYNSDIYQQLQNMDSDMWTEDFRRILAQVQFPKTENWQNDAVARSIVEDNPEVLKELLTAGGVENYSDAEQGTILSAMEENNEWFPGRDAFATARRLFALIGNRHALAETYLWRALRETDGGDEKGKISLLLRLLAEERRWAECHLFAKHYKEYEPWSNEVSMICLMAYLQMAPAEAIPMIRESLYGLLTLYTEQHVTDDLLVRLSSQPDEMVSAFYTAAHELCRCTHNELYRGIVLLGVHFRDIVAQPERLRELGFTEKEEEQINILRSTNEYQKEMDALSIARRVYSFVGCRDRLAEKFARFALPSLPAAELLRHLLIENGRHQALLELFGSNESLKTAHTEEYYRLLFDLGHTGDLLQELNAYRGEAPDMAVIQEILYLRTNGQVSDAFVQAVTRVRQADIKLVAILAEELASHCLLQQHYALLKPHFDSMLATWSAEAIVAVVTGNSKLSSEDQLALQQIALKEPACTELAVFLYNCCNIGELEEISDHLYNKYLHIFHNETKDERLSILNRMQKLYPQQNNDLVFQRLLIDVEKTETNSKETAGLLCAHLSSITLSPDVLQQLFDLLPPEVLLDDRTLELMETCFHNDELAQVCLKYYHGLLFKDRKHLQSVIIAKFISRLYLAILRNETMREDMAVEAEQLCLYCIHNHHNESAMLSLYYLEQVLSKSLYSDYALFSVARAYSEGGNSAEITSIVEKRWPDGLPSQLMLFQSMLETMPADDVVAYCKFCSHFVAQPEEAQLFSVNKAQNKLLTVAESELLINSLYLRPTAWDKWLLCAERLPLQSDPAIKAKLNLIACRLNLHPEYVPYPERQQDCWWRCAALCEMSHRDDLLLETLLAWSFCDNTTLSNNISRQRLILCRTYLEEAINENADYLARWSGDDLEKVRTILRRLLLLIPDPSLKPEFRTAMYVTLQLVTAFHDSVFLNEFLENTQEILADRPNMYVALLCRLLLVKRYREAGMILERLRGGLDLCKYGELLEQLPGMSEEEMSVWANTYSNQTLMKLMLPDCEQLVPIEALNEWAVKCISAGLQEEGLEIINWLCRIFPDNRAYYRIKFMLIKYLAVERLTELHRTVCALLACPASDGDRFDFRTELDYGLLLAGIQTVLLERNDPADRAYLAGLPAVSAYYYQHAQLSDIGDRSNQVSRLQTAETEFRDMLQNRSQDEKQRFMRFILSWVSCDWEEVITDTFENEVEWQEIWKSRLPVLSHGFTKSYFKALLKQPKEKWDDLILMAQHFIGPDRDLQLNTVRFCWERLNTNAAVDERMQRVIDILALPLEETALAIQIFTPLLTPEFLAEPVHSKPLTAFAIGVMLHKNVFKAGQLVAYAAFEKHEDRKASVLYHALVVNMIRYGNSLKCDDWDYSVEHARRNRRYRQIIALLSEDPQLHSDDLYDDIKGNYFNIVLQLLCSKRANEALLMRRKLPLKGREVVDAMLKVFAEPTDSAKVQYVREHPSKYIRIGLLYLLSRWREKKPFLVRDRDKAYFSGQLYKNEGRTEEFEMISWSGLTPNFALARKQIEPPTIEEYLPDDDGDESINTNAPSREIDEDREKVPSAVDDSESNEALDEIIEAVNALMELVPPSVGSQKLDTEEMEKRYQGIDSLSIDGRQQRAELARDLFLLCQSQPDAHVRAKHLIRYTIDAFLCASEHSTKENNLILTVAPVAALAGDALRTEYSALVNRSALLAIFRFDAKDLSELLVEFTNCRQNYNILMEMVTDEYVAKDINSMYRVLDMLCDTYGKTSQVDVEVRKAAHIEARIALAKLPYRRGWESLTTPLINILLAEYNRLDAQPQLVIQVLNVGKNQRNSMLFGEVENIGRSEARDITMWVTYGDNSVSAQYQLEVLSGGSKAIFEFGYRAPRNAYELSYIINAECCSGSGAKIQCTPVQGSIEITTEEIPVVDTDEMKTDTINIYKPTADGRDVSSPHFVGRKREKRMLRNLYDGKAFEDCRSALVCGIRRSGKTSLISYLYSYLNHTRNDLLAVYVDCLTTPNVYRIMVNSVLEKLNDVDMDEDVRREFVQKWKRNTDKQGDIDPIELPRFYLEAKRAMNGRGIILIIDELDRLLQVLSQQNVLESKFYPCLSSMLCSPEMADTVHFLLCGNKELIMEKNKDRQITQVFQRMGSSDILIGAMPKDEMIEMIRGGYAVHDSVLFTDAAMEWLWNMTGGLIWFSKLIARAALTSAVKDHERTVVYPTDIHRAATTLACSDSDCRQCFESCREDERLALEGLGYLAPRPNQLVAFDRLLDVLQDNKADITRERLERALHNLVELEMIDTYRQNSNLYCFRTEIYRRYFRKQKQYPRVLPFNQEQDVSFQMVVTD